MNLYIIFKKKLLACKDIFNDDHCGSILIGFSLLTMRYHENVWKHHEYIFLASTYIEVNVVVLSVSRGKENQTHSNAFK